MKITLPELCLVLLVGPSGCGKSTFAHQHFKSTEVLSSDFCRGLASDDENDQAATKDAFEILYFIARKRLAAGRLVVVDATNVRAEDRKRLIDLAREFHVVPVAIVFDVSEAVCHERNAAFLGDLVDRGPGVPSVLSLAMGSVGAGTALCVPGNHDIKLMRKLRGR